MDTRGHCYRKAARLSSAPTSWQVHFEQALKRETNDITIVIIASHPAVSLIEKRERTVTKFFWKWKWFDRTREKNEAFRHLLCGRGQPISFHDATFDLCSFWRTDWQMLLPFFSLSLSPFFAVHCCPNYGDIISPASCRKRRRRTIYHRLIKEQHKMFEFMSLA